MTRQSDTLHAEAESLYYRVCPKCHRAVPGYLNERHCINDGERLLERCPVCATPITSPYARHCASCGQGFGQGSTADY